MKFLKEKKKEMVVMPMEVTKKEMKKFIEYFDKNCPESKLNELKVEWAVNDMLEKKVEEHK